MQKKKIMSLYIIETYSKSIFEDTKPFDPSKPNWYRIQIIQKSTENLHVDK